MMPLKSSTHNPQNEILHINGQFRSETPIGGRYLNIVSFLQQPKSLYRNTPLFAYFDKTESKNIWKYSRLPNKLPGMLIIFS